LAAEQQAPSLRAITVRPGVIDTDMRAQARALCRTTSCQVSSSLKDFIAKGGWLRRLSWRRRSSPGLVVGDVDHGRTYSYQEL
jgi:hypothetical protein